MQVSTNYNYTARIPHNAARILKRFCAPFCHLLGCRALGIQPAPAVVKVLTPEDDAARPIEPMILDEPVGGANLRALAAALLGRGQGMTPPAYKPVKTLKVVNADGGDTGLGALAEVLRNGKDEIAIETFEYWNNGVTVVGCNALGAALTLGANASVANLSISHNRLIGDEGVVELAKGLRTNRNLKQLSLAFCSLTPASAHTLSGVMLGSLSILEVLDVSGNNLGSEGLLVLAEAARKSKTLQELRLSDNAIGGAKPQPPAPASTSSSEAAADSATAPELTEEELEATMDIHSRALRCLGKAVSEPSCRLVRVDLRFNPLTPTDATTLLPYLRPDTNKKCEMFLIDYSLPKDAFAGIFRQPAAAKGKKGKKK